MTKILIIDDDPGVRRVMARTLTIAGHQVEEAKDGIDGIAAYHRHLPDLVITDIVMPEKEGIEVIRELRHKAQFLPIIAISGSENGDFYLDMAISLGANAYLKKPFNSAQLLQMVRDLPTRARGAGFVPRHRKDYRGLHTSIS